MWIEIEDIGDTRVDNKVTSYAEVWIEIGQLYKSQSATEVTSYAEVWIEIRKCYSPAKDGKRHLLRGGVD